ncbi:MAG: FAD-binding protein, partial [Flavobacteriales bacterium]|nr:FAD-binding protein [Flavobacteriales bacterium]
NGKPFMHKYHKDADLAPRDIVSKAIFDEVQKSALHHVFLDCRSIEEARFMNHFPTIYARCLRVGIDPLKDLIPVAPAAHYVCGGIVTDENGKTSINSLYAIGECARTGLHGANRLASNSLLEALVFGHRAAKNIASLAPTVINNCCLETEVEPTNELTEAQSKFLARTKQELLTMMSEKVGIVRTTAGLEQAKTFIENARESVKKNFETFFINHLLLELDNLLTVAGMIVDQSLSRTTNLGGFFNKDLVEE